MPTKFYDFQPLISRNGVFNFVVGARGLGKTYGAKQRAIKRFLKYGEQWIYLRRYSTELKGVRGSIMNDIIHEFPGFDFKVEGDRLMVKRTDEDKKSWKIMAYFASLSKSQQLKSVSYHDVKTVIFDEFIIEIGNLHYLPREAERFMDFYSTIDRWKDKTKVYFLANALTIMNPYFSFWNIEPKPQVEWIKKADNFIIAHFPDDAGFTAEVFETRFGKFIQGTDYAGYSVGNEFKDNGDALLARKTPEARYHASIETSEGIFSLWIDQACVNAPTFYIQSKRPKIENLLTMRVDLMNENKRLIYPNDPLLQVLRTGYRKARVYFDRPQSRNAFAGIFERK